MHRSTYLRTVIIAIIIIAFCMPLSGCHSTQKFNWPMYGAMIDSNGQIFEHLQFTVEGILQDYSNKADQLNLQVITPDTIPYSLPNLTNVYTDEGFKDIILPYFACRTYGYNKATNEPVFSIFALDIDQEYVIIKWNGSGNSYLVGCTNPDADLTGVFAHFQAFVEQYSSFLTS